MEEITTSTESPPLLEGLSPDGKLAQLYKSMRPAVELIPGVALSALVNTAWLPGDDKAMLSESWIPVPMEPEEGSAPVPTPPSFDPSSIEFKGMMMRVNRSSALAKWNNAMLKIKTLEAEISKTKDEKVVEGMTAELEACKAQIAEAEGQLSELKASFQEPLSLVPWMQTMFDLVDAGLTTFEVGGPFFPYTNLRALFGADNTASFYESSEKVLGAFKKRCDAERGPGKVQIIARLIPNIFQDGYKPEVVEQLVEKIRNNLFGEGTADPLDFLQLYWWDAKNMDVLPTLKVLQKLSEDKLEINEESGEVTIADPKKIRGLGFVDFPARAIISAIQAGVPVVSVQIPFSIADRSHAATLAVCREYNLKVLARDGLLGGIISEKFLGAPEPESTQPDADLDDVTHSLELVNNYGGWEKVQNLLQVIKSIADKHGVKMQTVALRWQIDQGTFPIVATRWGDKSWRQFGFDHWGGVTPGVDYQIFQVESFLDAQDMTLLNAL